MKALRYISALFAVVLFLSSCSEEEGKVIPRSKLAEIYAEMLITDQWISDTPGVRRTADTSLVYEPIFEKYGYTTADYRTSVDKYMDDAERFSRILRTTVQILDKKIVELNQEKEEQERLKALKARLEKMRIKSDFRPEDFFPYLFDEPYVHYYDSLSVEPDSVLMVYRLRNIDRADTLFDGIKIVVRDTVEVVDTVKKEELNGN
jgi:hypothetical protein